MLLRLDAASRSADVIERQPNCGLKFKLVAWMHHTGSLMFVTFGAFNMD